MVDAEPEEPEWGTYNLAAVGVGRGAMVGRTASVAGLTGRPKRIVDDDVESVASVSLQTLVRVNDHRVGGEGLVRPTPMAIRV